MGDYLGYTNFYNVPDVTFLSKALSMLSSNIDELIIFSDSPEKAFTLITEVPESQRFKLSIDKSPCLSALRVC